MWKKQDKILKDDKIYFIDHDNFAIDNYKIDKMNRFMFKYIDARGKIDMNKKNADCAE